ncbi:MAG: hypothetical protein A3I61_19765 [Acidobacteria bacterium RIFCSPLOWO2_02_FULL_68_18]|nr:MAG: hypothetical protein A3I61_19765 [Acidobacteria bacterium RIFCSPLOWO2_02_FULL_68_18]OFW48297.1 MAG: hypothetical protein A3G77_03370 [Acidobacteria bacterium RIFCSPLOWO2_12_FULL_68_19]
MSGGSAKTDDLLGAVAHLATRNVVQQIVGTVRGLILPNLLGPAHYGVVATALLFEQLAGYVNLGVHTATLYLAPVKLAEGRPEEARAIHDAVLSFTALTGVAATTAIVGWIWISRGSLAPELVWPLLLAAGFPLFLSMRGSLIIWLRSTNQFGAVARTGVAGSLVVLFTTIAFGWIWDSTGVVVGQALSYVLIVGWLLRLAPPRRLSLNPAFLAKLLKVGIPIHMVLGGTLVYVRSLERIVAVRLFSAADVGYYAIGQAFASLLILVPSAVIEAIAPEYIVRANEPAELSKPFLVKTTFLMAAVMAVLVAGLVAALPGILRVLFPSFQAGVVIGQLLCLSAYFEAILTGPHYVVITRGRLKPYILFVGALALIASWVLAAAGRWDGIRGIASAAVVLTAVRALGVVWASGRLTGHSTRETVRIVCSLLVIGLTAVAAAAFVGWLLPIQPQLGGLLTLALGCARGVAAMLIVIGLIAVGGRFVHLQPPMLADQLARFSRLLSLRTR